MAGLGARLKWAREKKDLKQTQVKDRTGINNKTLSGYENEVSEPDVETLKTLATLYEVSLDWLMGKEKDSIDKLIDYLEADLTNDQIRERMTFMVDDIVLSDEDVEEFITFVRVKRAMKKVQAASVSNTEGS